MKTRYLFQFQNMAVSYDGVEYCILRLSDTEPLFFTPYLHEAIHSLLEQSPVFLSAPEEVKACLVSRFSNGDVETVHRALCRS